MTHREMFELGTDVEPDAPFDSVSDLCDLLEELNGPGVFAAILDAKRRFDAASAGEGRG